MGSSIRFAMQRSTLFLFCGLCALLSVDAFAPTALPVQNRMRLAASSTRPAAAVGLRMSAADSLTTAAVKLAEAAAPAADVAVDENLFLIGGGAFALIVPLTVVIFTVTSQGIFKNK